MLANIALIPFAVKLKNHLKLLSCKTEFHIYADDITITTDIVNYQLEEQIKDFVTKTITELKFNIKPTKTRVRYTTHGYVRVLGVNIGKHDMRVPRKIRRKIRAAKHSGGYQSLGGLTTWQNHIANSN